jgi:hypothetical protein
MTYVPYNIQKKFKSKQHFDPKDKRLQIKKVEIVIDYDLIDEDSMAHSPDNLDNSMQSRQNLLSSPREIQGSIAKNRGGNDLMDDLSSGKDN